jgi:hypothetical protein
MKKRIVKKIISAILVAGTSVGTMIPVNSNVMITNVKAEDFFTAGDFQINNLDGWSYEDGILRISQNGDYTIEMAPDITSTDDSIAVESGVTANITLGNVNIVTDKDVNNNFKSALALNNATVKLTLRYDAEIHMESEHFASAVTVDDNSKLTIEGDGKLDVISDFGSGIGGDFYGNGNLGEVVINSGEINVTGGKFMTGIGGSLLYNEPEEGKEYGNSGKITVNGGKLTAYTESGTAIGGIPVSQLLEDTVEAGDGGILIVNGGEVHAETMSGTAIGGGYSQEGRAGDGADVTLNGGRIYAYAQGSGTAIGGGWTESGIAGDGGSLTVNDGKLDACSMGATSVGGGLTTEGTPGKGAMVVINGGEVDIDNGYGCAVGGGCIYDSSKDIEFSGGVISGSLTPTNTSASLTINDGAVRITSFAGMAVCCEELNYCGGYFQIRNDGVTEEYAPEGDVTNITFKPSSDNQIIATIFDNETYSEIEGSPFRTETKIAEVLNKKSYTFETETIKSQVKVDIVGTQINTTSEGFRVVYSVDDPNNEVVEAGMVYGLANWASEKDMYVGSNASDVYSYSATDAGKLSYLIDNCSSTIQGYAMTMKFIKTTAFYQAPIMMRAYAKLSDGSYVYSNVDTKSVYQIADYLYQTKRMPNDVAHDYLYNNILVSCKPDYEIVYFLD